MRYITTSEHGGQHVLKIVNILHRSRKRGHRIARDIIQTQHFRRYWWRNAKQAVLAIGVMTREASCR